MQIGDESAIVYRPGLRGRRVRTGCQHTVLLIVQMRYDPEPEYAHAQDDQHYEPEQHYRQIAFDCPTPKRIAPS